MLKAIFPDGIDKITVYGLTQWDIGQQLQITLASLPSTFQVHFASKRDDVAYVVEGTGADGVGTVNIPNILLQNPSDANAWIYIGNTDEAETIKTICLPITPRAKPSDYVYEEIEILNYNTVIAKAQSYANAASVSANSAKTSEDNASSYANTANEAKNYVEAIVAGNEAYTKYESDTQYGSVIVQKASGSEILIKDSSGRPIIDFEGYGESEQTQYSGNNLFENTATSQTIYGVTFTVNPDGSVAVKGTATAEAPLSVSLINSGYKAGTYFVKSTGSSVQSRLAYNDGTGYAYLNGGNSADLQDFDTYTSIIFQMLVLAGTTVNETIYPMFNRGNTELPYEPYVGATASPNPSYPQRIEAIGDKGFFDGELLRGYYGNNGVYARNNTAVCSANKIPCKTGDVLKIKTELPSPTSIYIHYYNNGTYITSQNALNVNEASFTAPTDANEFHFHTNNSYDIDTSTAGHICVTINGMYALIVKENGKNNAKPGSLNFSSYFTYTSDKAEDINCTCTVPNTFFAYFSFYAVAGKGYRLCGDFGQLTNFYVYTDKLWGNLVFTLTSNYPVFSVPKTGTYIIGLYGLTEGATYSVKNFMIVDNEITDETYQPYTENNVYIPISAPLRSSLDGSIKDEVYKVDGKYVVERKFDKYIFNGSENWYFTANTNTYTSLGGYLKPNGIVISDHYIVNKTQAENTMLINQANVIIYDKRFATVEDWTTWLAENNVEVIYEKVTPTIEVLDQTPFYEMRTYDGVTHITSEADMEVSYATDTKTYIDNKIAEIQTAILNLS